MHIYQTFGSEIKRLRQFSMDLIIQKRNFSPQEIFDYFMSFEKMLRGIHDTAIPCNTEKSTRLLEVIDMIYYPFSGLNFRGDLRVCYEQAQRAIYLLSLDKNQRESLLQNDKKFTLEGIRDFCMYIDQCSNSVSPIEKEASQIFLLKVCQFSRYERCNSVEVFHYSMDYCSYRKLIEQVIQNLQIHKLSPNFSDLLKLLNPIVQALDC